MNLKTMEIPADLDVMEDGRPFFFEGGRTGCLLIHGFTGTTSSMRPMGEYMAARGLTVLGPRLPGHGTDVKDMGRWTCGDWTRTVEAALDELGELCDDIFVSGLSMGGTLTLYLAENRPGKVAGIMPVSAPACKCAPGVQHYALKCIPVLKYLLSSFPGPGGDIKDPSVTEVAYDKLSTKAAHELLRLATQVAQDIGRITAPIRIFHSREDHVVPPLNARFIYDNVSSKDKELIWLDNSFHVATLDFDKEKIFEDSYNFIRKITGA